MTKNFVFIYSIFSAVFLGIKTLPTTGDHVWSTLSDINELAIDRFDDVRLNLANGNNPFRDKELTLEIAKSKSGEQLSVTIKRAQALADKFTTVWYGQNTYTGFGDISYEKSSIDQVPGGFPDFAMFRSYEEKVALVAFGNETHWIWEGFIGNAVIQHILGDLYILIDITFPSPGKSTEIGEVKKYRFSTEDQLPMDLHTEKIYIIPEILVALDWKSVENKTPKDVIKEVIVYYNAVDMLFSQFSSPTIELNIAGIVIPKDSRSSPYFEKGGCVPEKEHYSNECISFAPVLNDLIRHFRKYSDVFLTKDYDILMGMTALPLCDANGICTHYGTSFESGTCENVDEDHYAPITGVVRHPHFRGNYFLAAREIGHILGSEYIAKWASVCYGGVMSEIDSYQEVHEPRLDWSTCGVLYISNHFEKHENFSRCMWNYPETLERLEGPLKTKVNTTVPDTVIECPGPSDNTTNLTTTNASSDNNPITTTASPDNTTNPIITTTLSSSTATSITTTTLSNSTATSIITTIIPAVTTTTIESSTQKTEGVSTTIESQTPGDDHSQDPDTMIIVGGHAGGIHNVIVEHKKNFKVFLGHMVHSIYDFVGELIGKREDR